MIHHSPGSGLRDFLKIVRVGAMETFGVVLFHRIGTAREGLLPGSHVIQTGR